MRTSTFTFTVDNVGNDEPITVPVPCAKVSIREQGGTGTTDYFIRAPYSTSAQFRKKAGEETIFVCPSGLFQTGQVIGYISTEIGSVTFGGICE